MKLAASAATAQSKADDCNPSLLPSHISHIQFNTDIFNSIPIGSF